MFVRILSHSCIKKTHKNVLTVLLLIVLSATGCTDFFEPDNNNNTGNPDSNDNQTDNGNTELAHNHTLLSCFYLYAEDELRPLEYYRGKGGSGPYGDVIAMYESMSDRYTQYWTPDKAQAIIDNLTTSGNLPLLGISISVKKDESGTDRVIINRVYEQSPAEEAGLLKDDVIFKVNGVEIKGETVLEQFQTMTEGGEDALIDMTVIRDGMEIVIPTMHKKTMFLPTVFLDYLNDIPVIQLTEFTGTTTDPEGTAGEFREKLRQITADGKNAAGIIDLRGNPGGSVDQCYAIIDELIAGGVYIWYEDHYYSYEQKKPVTDFIPKFANPGGLGENTQWVFLADGNSASAAEILLSAAANCLKTRIYGTQTYGKGIGQYYIWTLEKGLAGISALQFYDTTGNSYHGKGIAPDITESDPGLALEKALTYAVSLSGRRAVAPRLSPADIRALNARLIERQQKTAPGGSWRIISAPSPQ
jgi:C-terminal peptidase prc